MRRRSNVVGLVLVGAFLLAGTARSQENEQKQEVSSKIQNLLQDRSYEEAIESIEAAVAAGEGPADHLLYLKGRAFHYQRKYDDAALTFNSLIEEHPDSEWSRRARFAKAAAFARKGDYRAAELIYREEAEYLLSTGRKQELAEIFLDFAEGYFAPEGPTQKPDYEQARKFYEKALEMGPEPKLAAEIRLKIGRCWQEQQNFAEAAARYQEFVEEYGTSRTNGKRSTAYRTSRAAELGIGDLLVEARYLLGWSQLQLGQPAQARRTWQDLLADDELKERVSEHAEATERFAEATFYLAKTYGVPQPGSSEDLDLGIAALERFIEEYPGHQLASEAYLQIAQSLMHRGRYEEATVRLRAFLGHDERAPGDRSNRVPGRGREEAAEGRFLLGRCLLLQRRFDDAIEAWREYLAEHPAHRHWTDAQQQIIQAEYLAAEQERQEKDYDRARELWLQFLAKYPLDPRAAEILFLFGEMKFEQEQWQEAIAEWRNVVSKYPGSDTASKAQYRIALTLETKLDQLEEALDEYKKLTWGSHATAARQRIDELTSKQLAIRTERIFRSDETPRIQLDSRNIEEVTVKIYAVDLETYFRKMHLARGVEGLDIALIDPDETFTFKVPDYKALKPTESAIEIDWEGKKDAAAWAVTVSSRTLEATTLVLQSDLDVIVKSSRDEILVFSQNMRTGEPWAGARLLISDGSKVYAEAKTGEDGVLQATYEELKSAGDVRVFAVAETHYASNVINLSGLGVSEGLADKGYIYTDRPAYRAGQMVHVRGIIRRVDGDRYQVDEEKPFHVHVYDPRGRRLWGADVELSRFGSFHAHFPLPGEAPQGQYRIDVRETERHGGQRSYQGNFLVHEYKLEPAHLIIDTERQVYYRGEKITGTIRAEFYYGAPLAGSEIRYQLAGGDLQTATTDENGEVPFEFETREFRETQPLPLVVMLPERNLTTQATFILATRGFSIGLETTRDVFLAHETFETTITTTDAEGEPIGEKLEVKLLEQTVVDGRTGERVIETREVATDDEQGIARVVFAAEEGGTYIVRAAGIDRFRNPITADHSVRISDDDDSVRLRILAERHTFKIGDDARIRVHWREEPTLALVTYQGARVLGYQLFELKNGENEIPIAIDSDLAPNFDLHVAVMTDPRDAKGPDGNPARRFHEATTPLTVIREMNVQVAVKGNGGDETFEPGKDIEVEITTTDPQGTPLAAELSLAMIEQALLDRFPSQVAEIDEFFRGSRRESAVRTSSSVTFAYNPDTRSMDPALLAERERLEIAEEENQRLAELGDLAQTFNRPQRADAAGEASEAEPAGPAAAARKLARGNVSPEELDEFGRGRAGVFGGALGGGGLLARPEGTRLGAAGDYFDEDGNAGEYTRLSGPVEIESVDGTDILVLSGNERDIERVLEMVKKLDANGRGEADFLQREEAVLMQNNGQWAYLNWSELSDAKVSALSQEMAGVGGQILSSLHSPETAFWSPVVTTDENGKTTVTVTLPERSTAWQLTARGITTETLSGEGTAELTAKKDLFGELKLPLALVDGDKARIVATVHNDAVESGEIEVTLKTKIGTWDREETKSVEVDGKGLHEVVFETTIDRTPGERNADNDQEDAAIRPDVEAVFELTVTAGERSDTSRRLVSVLPYGMHVVNTTSGTANADTSAWIELPAEMPVESPSLEITIAPDMTRSLLDVVLAPQPIWCRRGPIVITSGLETASSDLLASLALMDLLRETQKSAGPEAQALDDRIRAQLGSLVAAQRDDGGWTWTGSGKDSTANPYVSARILWALSTARDGGYSVPDDSFNRAVNYVQSTLAQRANDDYETRAVLTHALAAAGQGDFAQVNRLYRERQSLSAAGLAYAALAFAEMDRKEIAGELLDVIANRNLIDGGEIGGNDAGSGRLSWNQAATEVRALYALALQIVDPSRPQASAQVDWLLAHRTGHRWSPDKATGPATLAVAKWLSRNTYDAHEYKLTVFVNNNRAAELSIEHTSLTQTIAVPDELLTFPQGASKQTVRFQLEGRGRYTYQLAFGGFVPADQVKATTKNFRVRRYYEPAPMEFQGATLPRGFGIVEGSYSAFRNPLTELSVGKRGIVTLQLWRDNTPSSTPEHELPYLVLSEPIPAGTTVAEDSVQGGFERYEIGPGAITFYIGNRRHPGEIRYELHGYVAGEYRTAPTVLRDAYDAGQLAVADTKDMTVLPFGQASRDEYRLTPQELFELGKRHFQRGEMAAAAEQLGKLLADWNVRAEWYRESVQMLLDAHLETGPAHKVVEYFEIIKEKWPELEIAFDKILKIGTAYHEMGEYERSYMVFRATVESRFMAEVRVAGFLRGEGEFQRSVDVMHQILAEYPPESYVAAAHYGLAQEVYVKAATASDDPKLREARITRVDLIRQAVEMLGEFLTHFPEDPAADQASFSLASALLELEQYEAVIAACERYMERFPKSELLDSFLYTIGFCYFALGEHEEALRICRRVAEMERTDERTGLPQQSQERWRAIYILGQIYHSLGKAAEALAEYTRVEDRFPDARQAIEFFTRRDLKLPEVTTLRPDEKKEVRLDFRNVAELDLRVYRIDLMKFSLLKRNLENIRSINLAGIRPLHEALLELGDGKDYRDRERMIELPIEDEGAYLVVCRGDDLHTSGLVLVSPLEVQVQEDPQSGRVRATVKNAVEDTFLADVHVKVIGSGNDSFESGETDLRGVFIADGITGTSTVIAQGEDDRYAFHRGDEYLGGRPNEPQQQAASGPQGGEPPSDQSGKDVLLEGLEIRNSAIQQQGQQMLERFYGNSIKGVQVEMAR